MGLFVFANDPHLFGGLANNCMAQSHRSNSILRQYGFDDSTMKLKAPADDLELAASDDPEATNQDSQYSVWESPGD
jgi:hypothetical protein